MSYDFDGVNDYILSTSIPATTVPLTYACWFNSNTTATGGLTMIAIDDNPGDNGFRMSVNTGKCRAIVEASTNSNFAETTASFSTSVWNHSCAVFASNASRSIYLNGGNVITDTVSRTPSSIALTRLHIGSRRNTSNTVDYFNGKMADVGVWNVALTAAEIASLAKGIACTLIRPQNLIFYVPLTRNLFDYSKSNLTSSMTNSGGALIADHPRIYL